MKTKKLKYTPDYSFKLIGISSSEEDYKLSWWLAKTLNAEFGKSPDLQFVDARFSEFQVFSVFENLDKDNNLDIRLVSNKGNMGYLIEELKNIDFFILVFEDEDSDTASELTKNLKSSVNVSAVFNLKPENLKSKDKLLF
jgi:hypothetical protein